MERDEAGTSTPQHRPQETVRARDRPAPRPHLQADGRRHAGRIHLRRRRGRVRRGAAARLAERNADARGPAHRGPHRHQSRRGDRRWQGPLRRGRQHRVTPWSSSPSPAAFGSAKVAKEVEKKLAFGLQSMGDQKVKNIAEPIQAFRVKLDGVQQSASPRSFIEARAGPWAAAAFATLCSAHSGLVSAGERFPRDRPQLVIHKKNLPRSRFDLSTI